MSAFGSKADIAKLLPNHAERDERGSYKLGWGPNTGLVGRPRSRHRTGLLASFSEIWEYFKFRAEIFSPLLR